MDQKYKILEYDKIVRDYQEVLGRNAAVLPHPKKKILEALRYYHGLYSERHDRDRVNELQALIIKLDKFPAAG